MRKVERVVLGLGMFVLFVMASLITVSIGYAIIMGSSILDPKVTRSLGMRVLSIPFFVAGVFAIYFFFVVSWNILFKRKLYLPF